MTASFILKLIALLFLLLAALTVALPIPVSLGWGGLFCWLLAEVIQSRGTA